MEDVRSARMKGKIMSLDWQQQNWLETREENMEEKLLEFIRLQKQMNEVLSNRIDLLLHRIEFLEHETANIEVRT